MGQTKQKQKKKEMKELAFAGSFPFFGWRREWPGENNKITLITNQNKHVNNREKTHTICLPLKEGKGFHLDGRELKLFEHV